MRSPRPHVPVFAATLLAFLLAAPHVLHAYDRANPPRLHVGGTPRSGTFAAQRPASAFPDAEPGYHNGAALACSDCHIPHASQSHALEQPGVGPLAATPYTGTPNPHILRTPDPLDLCLSCHDGQTFAPDVVGADASALQQRSAGHFDEPGVANHRGHDLARGLPSVASSNYCYRCHFSSGTQKQVTCVDCHDPHGNGRARNLQWASWPEGTPDLGLFVNPSATGMARYERQNVAFGTQNANSLREVTSICVDCHHVFSGGYYVDPDGDGIHNRHPSYESERSSTNRIAQGAAKGSSDPAHWEAGVGSGFGATPRVRPVTSGATSYAAAGVIDAQANGVFCLSCHAAHGSDQPFGLVFPAASGTAAPGCDQCHKIADVGGGPQPLRVAKR